MPLITPPGVYRFFDRESAHAGTVDVNADGTWQWRALDGATNSGKWGDIKHFTLFQDQRKRVVAKRDAKAVAFYDSTSPWFNTNLKDAGSMDP